MSEERMVFKAEVSRLLNIVVHALYSQKEIFLRELISNASDACDKLRYEALTTPELTGDDSDFRIDVASDPKGRTITVTDNGIGMSRDELIENLGTIAQSGTAAFIESLEAQDGRKDALAQIGQFGVGFYSAFMVAQMVEVVSRKAGSEEAFCWRSDGRGAFSIEEASSGKRGTSVTLYLKQGEDTYLSDDPLRSIIKHYSDHIAMPVYLNEGDAPVNQASALWLRPKNEITQEQYNEFYHHVGHAFDEPSLTLHWRAEGKIEYHALLFVPKSKPYDLFNPKRRHSVKLYVKRVFITDEAEGLAPPYLRFLRGVIDSEDLPLNVSREMLQNNPVLAKIRQGVTRHVLGDLLKYSKKTDEYDAFWGNFGAVLKEGIYEDSEHRETLLKLLRFSTTESDKLTSLADYAARMKKDQKAIYYLNGDSPETLAASPHLEGFKARGIEVLLLTEPVDDFWPAAAGSYEDKPFQSVTRAGQDLDLIAPLEEKDKEKDRAPDDEIDALIASMKLALGGQVKDVRVTVRLTESPVCLATDEGDLDIHLERFLKQHGQIKKASVRILEINPHHPLIRRMAVMKNEDDLKDISAILLDQARLLDGGTLENPAQFTSRLSAILAKVV
ncbi:MAG: molecular chaperone HtpG [Alphaproteobacteria bacterium]|nr:molecular chaperone HtpG [Alphaproteobacteria bacterium]